MKTLYQTLVLGLVAGSVAVAFAQPPMSSMQRGPMAFEEYDADGSGLISQSEFTAARNHRRNVRANEGRPMRGMQNAPQFKQLDANKDGNISQEELLSGQQLQQSNRGRGRGMGLGAGQNRQANMPKFSDFDLNRDGVITEPELIEARGARISERVKQGYQMRGLSQSQDFSTLDRNADGQLSESEFAAAQMQHRTNRNN